VHKLRFRQIHLDFHTSPHIPGIGAAFDKKQWQRTLLDAAVNSVTTFAVGHHGWSYFDTKVGKRHPELNFDLLRAQYDACKEVDINVPIYITAGVHNVAAYDHPEWREINTEGQYSSWVQSPLKPGFHQMCFNTPYLDYLCDVIGEVVEQFPENDGLFLDIISQGQCCCRWCMDDMRAEGYDPEVEDDRARFAKKTLLKYYRASTAAVRDRSPEMPVFHNSGHIERGNRDILEFFSHLELESLPTGGWGYDHFPMSAKYCQNLEHDFMGMTGKFHTTWGEFGGIKHPNALRYECAAMLAYGAKCSIGDQLHPCGQIDATTYSLIGSAYREVAEKEAWCDDVVPVADVAILSGIGSTRHKDQADVGAARVLLEGHVPHTVIDAHADLSQYRLLVVPDDVGINAKLKQKIDRYLDGGGKLFLSGDSGLDAQGEPLFDIGAEVGEKSEFSPDFILPVETLRPDFVTSPVVMYTRSRRLKVTDGESLGEVYDPYFNRTYEHFCSHQHTPYRTEPSGFDCGVLKGNILYMAHPVFTLYRGYGATIYKHYVLAAMKKLLGTDWSIETNMPSTARVSLNEQPGQDRYVLHLLYANTINRGGVTDGDGIQIEVIEDLLPLHDVEVSVRVPRKVKRMLLQPQGEELSFEQAGERILCKLDSFTCHQMLVIECLPPG